MSRRNKKQKTHSSGRLSPPVDVDSIGKIPKFESLIGPVLVFVYADWCGHCQHYKPLWKELANDKNRSINMAAVRDDMVNKTSLTQKAEPVTSYPTVMLIGKNGQAINFKDSSGAESQAIPDHGNMESMRAIVRNVGTPQGQTILEENSSLTPNEFNRSPEARSPPSNLTHKELSLTQLLPQPVETQEKRSGPSVSVPNIAADVVSSREQRGGGLFEVLSRTAYSAAPAAILLSTALMANKKQSRKQIKKRRTTRKRTTRRSKN